jgi:hypothetical protein
VADVGFGVTACDDCGRDGTSLSWAAYTLRQTNFGCREFPMLPPRAKRQRTVTHAIVEFSDNADLALDDRGAAHGQVRCDQEERQKLDMHTDVRMDLLITLSNGYVLCCVVFVDCTLS